MKYIFLLIASFVANVALGQTPMAITSSSGELKNLASGSSSFNPWLGAQLMHNFNGTNEFADNLIISGRILYQPNTSASKFKIPIMGNLSNLKTNLLQDSEHLSSTISEVVIGDAGLNLGLYPYYIINEYADDDFYLIAHGELGWKLNGFEVDSVTTNYLNTGRFALGFEMGYGTLNKITGDRPITLSVTPVISVFSKDEYQEIFGEEKSSITSLEITFIFPISTTGIGVMLQHVSSRVANNSFRAGIILTGQSKKDD